MMMVESDNGFGHFNIVNQIAQHIKARGGETAMASGTFYHPGDVFDFAGSTKFHLPPIVWDSKRKGFVNTLTNEMCKDDPHYMDKRKQATLKALAEFRPDVVMFELYPFYVCQYRDADLAAVREYKLDQGMEDLPIVCLSRDMIHSSKPEPVLKTLNEDFDHLLVRGDGVLNKIEDCQPNGKISS